MLTNSSILAPSSLSGVLPIIGAARARVIDGVLPREPDTSAADQAATADTADGGWAVESHSAPADPAPVDTTAGTIETASAAGPIATTDDGSESAGAMAGADTPPEVHAAAVTLAGSRKDKKARRYQEQERARHDAERRVADLERRNQELETRLRAPVPAAAVVAAPVAAAMPDPPRYADFETDEDYQAAVTKWKQDVSTWQTGRDEALERKITGGIDARLTRERESLEMVAAQRALDGRLADMRAQHPDFAEQVAKNAAVLEAVRFDKSPFIQDLVMSTPDGAEFLNDLVRDPDLATALGDLPIPTRPLRDAVARSPVARALMKYFATDDGRDDFDRLRGLHPLDVFREVGRLETRLETADRGSVASAHPISHAAPPARPPVGTPRARDVASAQSPAGDFDTWMADEDRKEQAARAARFPSSRAN